MYIRSNFKSNFKKSESEMAVLTDQPSSELGKTLPNQSSYYQGWVHYWTYKTHLTNMRPKKFYKNNNYFAQRVPMSKIQKKDKYGSMRIPNKSSFFIVVRRTGIHVFTSRDDTIQNQVDNLQIRFVKPIPEDKYLKGGVHDLGTFKIGHCLEVKAKIPNGTSPKSSKTQKITWVFCLDDIKEKAKLFKILIQLKLKQQRKNGKFETADSVKLHGKKKTLASMMAEKNKPKDDRPVATGPPQDGYWLLLQDWSPCSVKCGGGMSYQQWQCVPPKNGGKKCAGKSIKFKKCNTSKCPDIEAAKRALALAAPVIKKPIVTVAPFSNRLQRFEKCVVKENDAFITKFKKNGGKTSKMPVRILMNNSTITIYKDDKYENIHHSFELKSTQFKNLKSKFCCFNIQDSYMSTNLCGYEKFCGTAKNNKWANEWSDHFKLFKISCRVGRMNTLISPDDEAALAAAMRKRLGGSSGANRAKEEGIKAQMLQSQSSAYKSKVVKTQNMGLKAIQKEMQLENLIRNEEKEKEQIEVDAIAAKIQAEKDKAACLDHNIKERALDASALTDKRSAENEIKDIKHEAVTQVKMKRGKMKKLIAMMRAKAQLRKSAMNAELQAMRNKMAQKMAKSAKSGDMKYCKKGKINKDFRSKYCDKHYIEDFITNGECKKDATFCYMCCESEFGNMHIDKREKCYNMCDMKSGKKVVKKKANNSPGPFMWK